MIDLQIVFYIEKLRLKYDFSPAIMFHFENSHRKKKKNSF
jgi:hypothetical protein